MESTYRQVRPIAPAAGYIGGKRLLAKHLVPLIQSIPHRVYAEPFVGMGGIFLRRSEVPTVEVINDYSRDVATFFRVLQRHYPFFMEMLRFGLTSRREFQRLADTDPETLTDLERSARFMYLQSLSFGGKVTSRVFGVDTHGPGRFNVLRLGPILEALHERLAGVVIECLPYGAFITRYDRPETLFYLDPPYWQSERYYGKDLFERGDFQRIADQLAGIQGRFILSINDTPEIREIFGGFAIGQARTIYSAGHTRGAPVSELVVTNHPDCLRLLPTPAEALPSAMA